MNATRQRLVSLRGQPQVLELPRGRSNLRDCILQALAPLNATLASRQVREEVHPPTTAVLCRGPLSVREIDFS